jgi:hypothetical protein
MTSSPRATILLLVLAASASPLSAAAERRPVAPRAPAADELRAMRRTGKFLLLRTAVFDPTAEAPDFSAVGLPSQPDSPDYGVVQFFPGRSGEKERLAKQGVRFLGYLPENAWQVRLTPRTKALLDASNAVRWQGLWEPGFKVSPRLLPGGGEFAAEITVVLFPDVPAEEVTATLQARVPEAFRTDVRQDPASPQLRYAVPLSVRRDFLREAASIPGTAWLEPYLPRELTNNASLGPLQSNADSVLSAGACTTCSVFNHGLTGTGQIVAVADSGCDTDACFFRKSGASGDVTDAEDTEPPAVGTLWPGKKVIAYWVQPGATAYDNDETCRSSSTSFHGTHTSGTAVGDDYHTPSTASFPGIDAGDGMAPNAQLLFQDFGDDTTGCLVGTDDYAVYLQALTGGARVHSNSTGSASSGAYGVSDQAVDRFLFDHDEMTIFFSSGNSGPSSGTTGSPANSKNGISVGAVGHGNSTSIASFSSRGPTSDGRIKPDVVAPGQSVLSALGDTSHTSNNCLTQTLSGTSMACPTAAGVTALLRQYFTDGFYPAGARNSSEAFNPSAPLVKAVLLNGTLPLGTDPGFGGNTFGWGRVFLDDNLFFAGDPRKLRVWNLANAQGVKTGDADRYTVTVGAGQEFRATLVWSDAEGTLGAAAALVNDLDLTVTDGTNTWHGNSFATSGDSRLGGEADDLNNVEQVRLSAPAAGTYTLTVTARDVPGNGRDLTDRQGYALAVSMASCATKVTAAPTGLAAASDPVMGVNLSFTPAAGATATQVYRTTGGCSAAPATFQYVGQSAGTTFADARAQGGTTYSYLLRGADGCGEGPKGSCVTITPSGRCDLPPQFAGLTSAAGVGSECRIRLTWAPATHACANAQTLHYNVYRSPAASPSYPGTLIGTTTGPSFDDLTAASGTAYAYVVRAEEGNEGGTGPNGGTEESAHHPVFFAAASGAPGALGTWTDDGGDGGGQLSGEPPWQITATQAATGTHSYHNGPDGSDYPNLTCASLVSPALTLGSGSVLSYSARYNLEFEWDGVVVEISTDGGSTWADLPPTTPAGYPSTFAQTTSNPVNACGYPRTHGAFNGPADNSALTAWTTYQTNLSPAYDGKTVRVRWRFSSDPGAEFDGFYLDAISVTNVRVPGSCTPAPNNPPTAAITSPASAVQVEAGVDVAFAGTGSDPDPFDTLSYRWDFGDGTPAVPGPNPPSRPFAAPGTYVVTFTVTDSRGTPTSATRNVTVTAPSLAGAALYVPVVLDTDGAGGSHYVSELTLASRAAGPVDVLLSYTGTTGGGSGYARLTLPSGAQQVIPGVLSYLRSRSVALPAAGSPMVGTLLVTFSGVASVRDVFAGTRTYTKDPAGGNGTFGLFYPASPLSDSSVTVFGLQQNASQRSNLAVQNGGAAPVTLHVELFGPAGEVLTPFDVNLGPYGWSQKGTPLAASGVTSGRARVTRTSGTSPFAAYGVLNDVKTSDGSFLTPLLPGDPSTAERLVPIVLSASGYSTELTLTNLTSSPLPLTLTYTASPQPGFSTAGSGTVPLTLGPGQQRVEADALAFLRSLGLPIPAGVNAGGSLLVLGPAGSPADALAAGARTFTAGPAGGSFGVFYAGLSRSEGAADVAYVYGLQQNDKLRSNLAAVNRGDAGDVTLRVTFYDASGTALTNPVVQTLGPGVWFQLNQPLSSRGAAAGFAKVERISGASRFVAYGVLNDRVNSDGSYVAMSVP